MTNKSFLSYHPTIKSILMSLFKDPTSYLSTTPPAFQFQLLRQIPTHPWDLLFNNKTAQLLFFGKHTSFYSSIKYFAWKLSHPHRQHNFIFQITTDLPNTINTIYGCQTLSELKSQTDNVPFFLNSLISMTALQVSHDYDPISWLIENDYEITVDAQFQYRQNSMLGMWSRTTHPSIAADIIVVDLPNWVLESYKSHGQKKSCYVPYDYHSKLNCSDFPCIPVVDNDTVLTQFPDWVLKIYNER